MGTSKRSLAGGVTRAALSALLAVVLIVSAGCAVLSRQSAGEDSVISPATPPVYSDGGVTEEAPSAPADEKGAGGFYYGGTGDVATDVPEADRLIIRNKMLRVEVTDVPDAVSSIRAISDKYDGVITALQVASETDGPIYRYDEQMASNGAALSGYVTIRVPVAKFDALAAEVMKLGTVRTQSETSDDVTQQHVDLAARLENLRAEEKRLREFFDAAKNVNDMLAIEQELARVRGEIEGLDAQVKYLERQAAMATVTIELIEPSKIIRPEGEDWGFKDAITAGVRGAANVLRILITVLITVAPYAVIGLAVFFGVRAIVRSRRRRSPAPPNAPTTAEPDDAGAQE